MKKLTLQKWEAIIEDYDRSGLSVPEYCDLHGMDKSYFYKSRCEVRKWQQKHQQPSVLPAGQDNMFRPVQIVLDDGTMHSAGLARSKTTSTTVTVNGIELRLPNDISEPLLEKLVRACV